MARIVKTSRNLEIKKSEAIVKARYTLSPLAIKLITLVIANIKETDDVNEEYVFKVKEFKELTGLKRKDLYKAIDEAVVELLNNPIKIPLNDEKNSFRRVNWISSGDYNAGEIIVMISPKLRPYLLKVKEKFLKYKLENILPLRSAYTIRMYEILKDWFELNIRYGTKTEKIISLDELKKMLEIPESYRYNDIKRRVLEKSKSELKKHTDIVFDYEEIKTGRKVTHLKFFIYFNPDKQIDYNKKNRNFASRRNFVELLRKHYNGKGKFFGFIHIDKERYWLGLDKKGLLYATSLKEGGIKDFNANESLKIYDLWYKIAKHSELYQFLLESGNCLRDLYKNERHLWNNLNEEIEDLKASKII